MKLKRKSKKLSFEEMWEVYRLFYSLNPSPLDIQRVVVIMYPNKVQLFKSPDEVLSSIIVGLYENEMEIFLGFVNGIK